MDTTWIEAICGLGVGGVFGIVAFLFYRRDRKASELRMAEHIEQLREDRKFMEDRMNMIIDRDQASREKHTTALEELTTLLQRLNGRIK